MRESTDNIPTLHMGKQRAERAKCNENSKQGAENPARVRETMGKVS